MAHGINQAKEVVWIFGNSAAGKETFAKYIVTHPNSKIAHALGWKGKKIVVCEESIDFVGQFKDDPIVERRNEILQYTNAYLLIADVVLIKWQYTDSVARFPSKLFEILPKCKHRIICLQTTDEEFSKRLPKKNAWHKGMNSLEVARRERAMVANEIAKLKDKFALTTIESTHLNNYKIVK